MEDVFEIKLCAMLVSLQAVPKKSDFCGFALLYLPGLLLGTFQMELRGFAAKLQLLASTSIYASLRNTSFYRPLYFSLFQIIIIIIGFTPIGSIILR
jgi:hypothetical protein